jgi:two-component system, chemotaxis family, CheB/CheR fusion protein
LQIMRFTPSARQIINLIPSDVGRPINHLAVNLIEYSRLTEDIQDVLDTLVAKEIEVETTNKIWFSMRIQPYRTLENVIEGAVLTFIDITRIKDAEEALSFSQACYHRLFESAKEGILVLDSDTGKITDANPYIINLLGFSREQMINRYLWEIGQFKDIASNQEKFLDIKRNGATTYKNLPIIAANGREIEVEFTSNLFQLGTRSIVHCHVRVLSPDINL